jgi:transcriptional activator/AAA ATPase-like protein
MKSLAVRVLSDFAVDGVEPQSLGSRKGRLALCLLALAEGQVVPADVLTDALWGDAPPAQPEDQLAVLISRLRSVLGRDRIPHRDRGYLLVCDWLDASELAALTEEMDRRRRSGNALGAAAAARIALSLLRGFGLPAVPGEWAQLRLAELDRRAGRARRLAATALFEAGDWMAAADAATAAVAADGYDEESLRILLRAYVAGGRVAAALAAYAQVRERLAADLGTDPSPETVALYTAILRGELPAPSPTPARGPAGPAGPTAPAGLIGLVGREAELAYLDATAQRARDSAIRDSATHDIATHDSPLRDGATEIVVVDGEAGIGKTALLRAWAAHRTAAGDTVLMALCGQLDRAMPLDALLSALAALLRRLGPDAAADLLGPDAVTLALDPADPPASGVSGPVLADSMLGPAVLYAALVRVLARLAQRAPLAVVIDDAHLAGQALANWLSFARRENMPVAVVAAVRSGEGPPLPATASVHLGLLDRAAVAELVGPSRADQLYERSKGHPLFLTELAQQAATAELPASLVESVSARCDELGPAGAMLRAAAVIGPELDIELLAALLGRPAVDVLDDAERAAAQQLLATDGGTFRFRHELVREALAASATVGRAALLHRQAGRVLARQPYADPALVAYHARLGGDLVLAARSLRTAAERVAERFDHAAAEALLDDALSLYPEPEAWLERARVRTRRRRYAQALADVELAAVAGAGAGAGIGIGTESARAGTGTAGTGAGTGTAALEVGAWACYFDRRFTQAAQFAADGALAAADPATRSRCLAVGGRIRHAAGDLAQAELLLGEAFALAEGTDRVTAAAWLGVLRAHQSKTDEALALLRPAARAREGVAHTAATLHSLLFTGHAHAVAGRPALALEAFARYTAEVDRRQVPRFAGRAVNFTGWVLRNLGAAESAHDRHVQALELGQAGQGIPELAIAALQDLAEEFVAAGDEDRARERLAQARAMFTGDLVFGWRLELKHQLITARLALQSGDPQAALAAAAELQTRAAALGVPRYVSVARVLVHRARRALGLPVDLDAVAADLDLTETSVAVEAWWWTGETAADFAVPAWLDLAADRAERLARQAGDYQDTLRQAAARHLETWRRGRPALS